MRHCQCVEIKSAHCCLLRRHEADHLPWWIVTSDCKLQGKHLLTSCMHVQCTHSVLSSHENRGYSTSVLGSTCPFSSCTVEGQIKAGAAPFMHGLSVHPYRSFSIFFFIVLRNVTGRMHGSDDVNQYRLRWYERVSICIVFVLCAKRELAFNLQCLKL